MCFWHLPKGVQAATSVAITGTASIIVHTFYVNVVCISLQLNPIAMLYSNLMFRLIKNCQAIKQLHYFSFPPEKSDGMFFYFFACMLF